MSSRRDLPQRAYLGIDETGHPECGRGLWSWCFHVPGQDRFTWFCIDPSRGSQVLKRYLGKAFQGIIGCDTWHRRGQTPEGRWERAATKARREVLSVARRAPTRSEAQNIAKRFRDHADAYFTFLDTPGIEPTNNGPERQIRFPAIDRKITQGTRGEAGRRWCERIWTMLATCAQQGRSAFEFLYRSIVADFNDQPFPSLLPLPP